MPLQKRHGRELLQTGLNMTEVVSARGGCVALQTVVELFLGLRLKQYFPSARLPYTDSLPRGEGSDSEDSETDDPSLSEAASKVCRSTPSHCPAITAQELMAWIRL